MKESNDFAKTDVMNQVYIWWMHLGMGLLGRERHAPNEDLEKHKKVLLRSVTLLKRAYLFCSKRYGKKYSSTISTKQNLEAAEADLAKANNNK